MAGGAAGANALQGNRVLKGLVIPGYLCPSTTINPLENATGVTQNNQEGVMSIQYVGIAGSARPVPGADPNNGTFDCGHGWSCNNGMLVPNEAIKIAKCTDGTSNTMLLSEVVFPAADETFDIRGDWLNDDRPCSMYMTINTPNTSVADVSPFVPSPLIPEDPPYTSTGSDFAHKAARSRHTGGVNVAFADGSVRMVQDGITPAAWQALGSMNGEEVITE